MIGRAQLDLAMVAYSEAGTTSTGALMAGIDPGDLMQWAFDCTGPDFDRTVDEELSEHSIHAGLIATGVLIGVSVGRPR